jgi:hypothetical protein
MEIQPNPNTPPTAARPDLRPPEVQFGRCCITREFGKVVAVDLGDIAIEAPVTDEGVEYNAETGEVTFNKWKPAVFATQALFSEEGLEMLLAWSRSQESPIPMITPELVYAWMVNYKNGSALAQFRVGEDDKEIEVNSKEIDKAEAQSVTLSPRGNRDLPIYSFAVDTGRFYRNGQEIDTDYDGEHPENAPMVYGRKVTHTFGSSMGPQLARTLISAHTTVLQLIGWHEAGMDGLSPDRPGRCNIIAVDDRGNWRPWRQS